MRNKLFDKPYSFTNCVKDLLLLRASFFFPRPERNHLLKGINTTMPTRTETNPTGKNEKKDNAG